MGVVIGQERPNRGAVARGIAVAVPRSPLLSRIGKTASLPSQSRGAPSSSRSVPICHTSDATNSLTQRRIAYHSPFFIDVFGVPHRQPSLRGNLKRLIGGGR
jgi:hypothetical protein